MKFEEALAAMMKGKTIKRKGYAEHISLNDMDDIELSDCLYVEWEIYEPKWEPERGMYLASSLGVRKLEYDEDITPEALSYGLYRTTREQAEAARDKMRTFNRLLAYVDEHSDPAETCECFVVRDQKTGRWNFQYSGMIGEEDPTRILMPESVAERLVDDLNSGRVVL